MAECIAAPRCSNSRKCCSDTLPRTAIGTALSKESVAVGSPAMFVPWSLNLLTGSSIQQDAPSSSACTKTVESIAPHGTSRSSPDTDSLLPDSTVPSITALGVVSPCCPNVDLKWFASNACETGAGTACRPHSLSNAS